MHAEFIQDEKDTITIRARINILMKTRNDWAKKRKNTGHLRGLVDEWFFFGRIRKQCRYDMANELVLVIQVHICHRS